MVKAITITDEAYEAFDRKNREVQQRILEFYEEGYDLLLSNISLVLKTSKKHLIS